MDFFFFFLGKEKKTLSQGAELSGNAIVGI